MSALDPVRLRAALAGLPDPELPVVSIDELGILGGVETRSEADRDVVRVELRPTFVACPATELIRHAVAARLTEIAPDLTAEVAFVYDPPWTSDRISPAGRRKLAAAGIAPPSSLDGGTLVRLDEVVPCPLCGSRRTRLDNVFGPTLCRTIRWCADCRQPFEAMKPV